MIELQGKYTNAVIYTDNCESEAQKQILDVCNHVAFENAPIRVMPDVHAGAGCVIGFTAPLTDKVIPNIIGVDIGCHMRVIELARSFGSLRPDFDKLDRVIRTNVPSGFDGRRTVSKQISKSLLAPEVKRICVDVLKTDTNAQLLKCGSLGGGNHFIELNKGSDDKVYLVIHSGSRNFGNLIAKHYQRKAMDNENHSRKDLCYLEGQLMCDYLRDMKVAQDYAKWSTNIMAAEILRGMEWDEGEESFTTTHNYIDDTGMIRKGAVSARESVRLLIPLNMRDGSVICSGKGNSDWNTSAPHGAGRLMSRGDAKRTFTLEAFQQSMEGIYTTCVSQATLDEAPMVYKDGAEIVSLIGDTVDIIDHIKPLYNFKGS